MALNSKRANRFFPCWFFFYRTLNAIDPYYSNYKKHVCTDACLIFSHFFFFFLQLKNLKTFEQRSNKCARICEARCGLLDGFCFGSAFSNTVWMYTADIYRSIQETKCYLYYSFDVNESHQLLRLVAIFPSPFAMFVS